MDIAIMITALVLGCIGGISYNSLCRKYEGVIGVFGAYFITTGIGMLILGISGLSKSGLSELLLVFGIAAVALLYMVYIMIKKCKTVKQRILLPFVAILIGFGFAVRITLKIFLRIPMASPKKDTSIFPKFLLSHEGENFCREDCGSSSAEYVSMSSSRRVTFYKSDFPLGSSARSTGWREGPYQY